MATSLGVPAQPLISVVMPVYNAERYVADAIASILAQTYAQFEFIIVDDGSTDGSAAIVRAFAARDARVRPLFLTHYSIGRARNAGIALTQGGLIAHMDADDIALPERLAMQLDWMRRTGVDICGSCVKRFGDEDGLLWFPETHAAICHELLFRNGLLQPSVLLRADIPKAHPYDERLAMDDYELWTRLAPFYRMGNVPQILLKYRCHPRQNHIVKAVACLDEVRKARRPYFHMLFPEATAEDYAAFAPVADKEPLESLAALQQACEWLLRLARTPDRFLCQRMARRWWIACLRSAHLGLGGYRLYRQMTPQFDVGVDPRVFALWAACLLRLRLREDSKVLDTLRRLKSIVRKQNHASQMRAFGH